MALEAQLMVGPIGPDTIQIPGEPQRLRRAAEGLREMCRQLDDIGKQLRHADAPEDRRGRTVRSLSRVAGRTGQTLQADSDTLQQLCDAVQNQADLLTEAHGKLDELRGTWRQARQELRDAVHGEQTRREAKKAAAANDGSGGGHEGKNGGHGGGQGGGGSGGDHDDQPLDVGVMIGSIDADVADKHQQVISRLSGVHFGGEGGGGHPAASMLVDEDVDRAMTTYRHQVDQVLEDLTESMRRVHQADEQMSEHLHRNDKAFAQASAVDLDTTPQDQPNVISGPDDIRSVAQEVHQAAQSIDQAAGQLREIRLGIREGRMLPDDDRVGSSDGFQRSWTEHFDDLRQDLNHARKAGSEIADRLREIDDNGASDVHRAGRGAHGGGGGQGA